MLAYRLRVGQNIFGHSYCDHTGKQLKVYDLIPIVSFIFFRGKCRECGKKLPLLYPLVELANAIVLGGVFFVLYDKGVGFLQIALLLVLLQVMFFLAIYDFKYWAIPKFSYIPIAVITILLFIVNGLPYLVLINGICVVILLILVRLLIKKSGFNFQEILIIGLLGLNFTTVTYLWLCALTSFLGFIFGSLRIILRRESIATAKIQLFPYIFVALLVVLTLLY
jgi:prepilin signal peptidase PulO-like enzyme (type II secretory pathway)